MIPKPAALVVELSLCLGLFSGQISLVHDSIGKLQLLTVNIDSLFLPQAREPDSSSSRSSCRTNIRLTLSCIRTHSHNQTKIPSASSKQTKPNSIDRYNKN